MKTLQLLKTNFTQAVLKIAGKSYLPILFLNIALIMFFILIAFVLLKAFFGLGSNIVESFINGTVASSLSMAIFSLTSSLNGKLIIVVITLFFLLFYTWLYNLSFLIINEYIKTDKLNIAKSFKDSFSVKLLKCYVVMLILLIITTLLIIIATLFGTSFFEIGEGFGYTFVSILTVMSIVFLLRFILVYSNALLSDKSIIQCFVESFKKVDFTLAIKYFLVTVLVFIVHIFFTYLHTEFTSLFIANEKMFFIILLTVNLLYTSLFSAFTLAITLAVYYKHYPIDSSEEVQLNLEENLIL